MCVNMFRVLGLHQQNCVIHLLQTDGIIELLFSQLEIPQIQQTQKKETKYMNDGI